MPFIFKIEKIEYIPQIFEFNANQELLSYARDYVNCINTIYSLYIDVENVKNEDNDGMKKI